MKTIKLAPVILLFLFMMDSNSTRAAGPAKISYTVTFPEAQAHYADIEMNISGLQQKDLVLKMPIWTPGSYLVREFSKTLKDLVPQQMPKTCPF